MLYRVLPVGDAQFLIQVANVGLDGGGRHVKLASMRVTKPEAAGDADGTTEVRVVTVAAEANPEAGAEANPDAGTEQEITVRLSAHSGGTSVPSCGKEPKQTVTWVAEF